MSKKTTKHRQHTPQVQDKQTADSKQETAQDKQTAGSKQVTVQGKQTAGSKPETAQNKQTTSNEQATAKNGQARQTSPSKSVGAGTSTDRTNTDKRSKEKEPEKFRKISVDGTDNRMPKNKAVKKSLHADNNLDMLGMSRKERRATRKELYQKNTEGMTPKEKSSYFFAYYKWYVIAPILIIAFVCILARTIYMNKRPVALGFTILNARDTDAVDLSFEDDYVEHFDITGSYQFKESIGLDIDYYYYKQNQEYIQTSNSTDYTTLSSDCDLGNNDILISNETGVLYCTTQYIVKPLKSYFSENVYAKLEPYMVSFNGPTWEKREYAIDISDTEFAKNLNLGYTDVYVTFPGVTDGNYTNSLRFLEYVLGIDLGE